jgi:hypothetical protein
MEAGYEVVVHGGNRMNSPFRTVAVGSHCQEVQVAALAIDLAALDRIAGRGTEMMASAAFLPEKVALSQLEEVCTHYAGQASEAAGCSDDWEVVGGN